MFCTQTLAKRSDQVEKMSRNMADTETNETDYSREFYRKNLWRPQKSTVRQSHHRLARNESCARCEPSTLQDENHEIIRRKKKTKNQLQHCPSCHCPPETLVFSPARTRRNSQNFEAVLNQYEDLLASPAYSGPKKSQRPRSPLSVQHLRPLTSTHCSRRGNGSAVQHQLRKNEQVLEALMKDLMSSGLVNEETEGCCRYQDAPIKNIYKKDNRWDDRQIPRDQDHSDVDSDCPVKSVHNRPRAKSQSSNPVPQQLDNSPEQLDNSEKEKDRKWKQFERDRQELDQLDLEIRTFEKWKSIRQELEESQHETKLQKRTNDEEEQLNRRVNFFNNKLPVAQFNDARPSSLETAGGKSPKDEQTKSRVSKMEASTSYHSILIDKDEFVNDHGDYAFKDERLEQELKSIPYCTPYRCPSVVNSHVNKHEEGTAIVTIEQGSKANQEDENATRKNLHAGGDLDLHVSKGYIVDLIDRALSRELGSIHEERKEGSTRQGSTQQEICAEITRSIQGDYCQSLLHNSGTQQEVPNYVRQLKVLRWEYLNHIQDELRKLYDLERFLDTCSPRQTVPVLHSQTCMTEQKTEQLTVS